MLTQGNPVGPAALLSYLHPAVGSFTGVAAQDSDAPIYGKMIYTLGERSAHLSFLAPAKVERSPSLPLLVEGLTVQSGEWGAFNLLADVEEYDPIFESLRRCGFGVYAWQRIWKLSLPAVRDTRRILRWRPAAGCDSIGVRTLYQSVVPPLVASAESLPGDRFNGLVLRQAGEVRGYVECAHGPRGIFLQPVFHPDVEDVTELLEELRLCVLDTGWARPLYVAVRSYQAWLEPMLESLGALAAPRQALMVKRMGKVQMVLAQEKRRSVVEPHRTEPTTPIINRIK